MLSGRHGGRAQAVSEPGSPQFTRRRYLRLLAARILRTPLLAAVTGLVIGLTISLLIGVA
jgi:hypothetical protein